MELRLHVDSPTGCFLQNLHLDIVGWAAAGDAKTLQQLIFSVDDVVVPIVRVKRPDVERALPQHAVTGWTCKLDHRTLLGGTRRTLLFEVRHGKKVLYRRAFLKSRLLVDERNNSPLFFMHIPKTAGTALREFVDCAFRDLPSFYVYGHYPGVTTDVVGGMPPLLLRSRELVYGHFGFGATRPFGTPHPKVITIFREPSELLKSYAAFDPDPHAAFFDNPLVRHVSRVGYSVGYGQVTEQHLAEAVKLLDRHFHVIHTEQLQTFADAVTEAFRLPRYVIPVVNKGKRAGSPAYPVEPLVQFDRRLYEHSLGRSGDFLDFLNAPAPAAN